MEIVSGLFRNTADADQAVNNLVADGFPKDSISVIVRGDVFPGRISEAKPAQEVAGDAGVGLVGGGVLGGLAGLLIGVGALAIPGIGPVFAAGSISAALASIASGAGVGGAIGGILGAMTSLATSEEDAELYAEGVKRGGVLVSVSAEGMNVDRVRTILSNSGAVDIEDFRKRLKQSGWKGFSEGTEPEELGL